MCFYFILGGFSFFAYVDLCVGVFERERKSIKLCGYGCRKDLKYIRAEK